MVGTLTRRPGVSATRGQRSAKGISGVARTASWIPVSAAAVRRRAVVRTARMASLTSYSMISGLTL
jgi:hypothetical protein